MREEKRDPEAIDPPLPIIATPETKPSEYTAREVSRIVGVTPRCIYQYAAKYRLGRRIGEKVLIFDIGDVRIMRNLHLTKSVDGTGGRMRNVSRRYPDQMLVLLGKQDELVVYVRAKFRQLRDDAFKLINDVDVGLHTRVSKIDEGYTHRFGRIEEAIKVLDEKIDGVKRPRRGGSRGRGPSLLSGAAALTQNNYEAEAA